MGQLIMPSLDLAPLQAAAGVESFPRVTLCVGVNSDSSNDGLGVVLEASPMMDVSVNDHGIPSYVYSGSIGFGVSAGSQGNCVKFHPGMSGGALRVEGRGGWH